MLYFYNLIFFKKIKICFDLSAKLNTTFFFLIMLYLMFKQENIKIIYITMKHMLFMLTNCYIKSDFYKLN